MGPQLHQKGQQAGPATMGVVCLLLGLLGVAWGIPAVNRASVLQSAGSADPSPSGVGHSL